MKTKCLMCEVQIEFVPTLDEIQEELKEKILDEMQSSTEAEMAAFIDDLQKRVLDAVQDAANETVAHLDYKRKMAAKKFGAKP